MAESANDQQGKSPSGRRFSLDFVQSTANQMFGWFITSLLGGAGAAYALTTTDLLKFGEKLKMEVRASIQEELEILGDQHDKIGKSVTGYHQDVTMGLGAISNELRGNAGEMSNAFAVAVNSHNSLAKGVRDNWTKIQETFEYLDKDLDDIFIQISDVDGDVAKNHKILFDRIEALSDQLQSYHRAFTEQMEMLAAEGDRAINKRIMADVEKWIAKANYMLRSLPIPTEEGMLKDSSIVKVDLRKAMRAFSKEREDDAKLEHARRVLVIVEAVRDLASSGRIPQSLSGKP